MSQTTVDSAIVTLPEVAVSGAYQPGPERFVLIGLSGPAEGLELVLHGTQTVLGRSRTCDVSIGDDHLSRRHVRLTLVPDEHQPGRSYVMVEDLASRNGVRVNGHRVVCTLLGGGEKIFIGRSVLRLDRRDEIDLAHDAARRAQSQRDPLTGLGNRQALEEAFARVEQKRQHEGTRYAVLLVDLDHFKQVNDRYGHAAGDAALRYAARTIQDALRTSDAAFRQGGEEFVVILPQASLKDAYLVAERIRAAIESSPIPHEDEILLVTASVGVAEGDTQAIENADRAMYEAKRAGRNRVN